MVGCCWLNGDERVESLTPSLPVAASAGPPCGKKKALQKEVATCNMDLKQTAFFSSRSFSQQCQQPTYYIQNLRENFSFNCLQCTYVQHRTWETNCSKQELLPCSITKNSSKMIEKHWCTPKLCDSSSLPCSSSGWCRQRSEATYENICNFHKLEATNYEHSGHETSKQASHITPSPELPLSKKIYGSTKTKHVTHKVEANKPWAFWAWNKQANHPSSVHQSFTIVEDLWKYQDKACDPQVWSNAHVHFEHEINKQASLISAAKLNYPKRSMEVPRQSNNSRQPIHLKGYGLFSDWQ